MYLLTSPNSALWYLRGQLADMERRWYQTTFVSSWGEPQEIGGREGMMVYPLEVSRGINPLRALVSRGQLHGLLGQVRFKIVNIAKTGLVGGLVSRLWRVQVRVYTLHSLRLETASGTKRRVLTLTERSTILCAHRVVAVNPSLREQELELDLTSPDKIVTLRHGSESGIGPREADRAQVEAVRSQLSFPECAVAFSFMGHSTRDHGVLDLGETIGWLRDTQPQAWLLVMGLEEGDLVDPLTRRQISQGLDSFWAGCAPDAAPYFTLIDVLGLPSYREGFPPVALEDVFLGLPLITTDATGACDVVKELVTGLRVPSDDVAALHGAQMRLSQELALGEAYGQVARKWVLLDFSYERLWQAWYTFYHDLLIPIQQQRAHSPRLGRFLLRIFLSLTLPGVLRRLSTRRHTEIDTWKGVA